MAKINTTNYQPVTAWNGTQDLFVVEQPDGTKVATPAQLKQYVEAGDFEATGEVKDGHGNILKNMAKSADVDAEIGDLSQTGLTGDSVAEQLGTAGGQIADINTALTNLESLNPLATRENCTVQNIVTLFRNLEKNKLHTVRTVGGQTSANIFGGSGLTMIGIFSSNSYGWVLCLSDNANNGIRLLTVNITYAYLQTPNVTVTPTVVS